MLMDLQGFRLYQKNQIKNFLANTKLKGKIIKEDIRDIVDSVNKVFSKGNLSDIERYLLRDKRREKNRLEKTQKKEYYNTNRTTNDVDVYFSKSR